MLKALRIAALFGSLMLLALALGFAAYTRSIQAGQAASAGKADGIVVLTGGDDRILRGLELMATGRGQRLLISGVHRSNRSIDAILRGVSIAPATACCIDLGYGAKNTAGNADEARAWAKSWGFRRLLVVTSEFHMPRSLVEFSSAMPGVELIAHPVPTRYLLTASWWQDGAAARLLAGEYAKLLAAKLRLALASLVAASKAPLFARTGTGVPQAI